MDNPEADVMKTNWRKYSCVEARENPNENKFQKLRLNRVSPFHDPIVESAIAEERLKKLERKYACAEKKCTETRTHWWGLYKELEHAEIHYSWTEYRIGVCKGLVEQLQKGLGTLEPKAISKGIETRDHSVPDKLLGRMIACKFKSLSLHFLMQHGNKSQAQEKMLLRQRIESQESQLQEGTNDLSQENIDLKRIHLEFSRLQKPIAKYSEKKRIQDLLREVDELKKSGDNAIANGALDGNPTSQERLTESMENEVKLLTKLIGKLEQERREKEHARQIARQSLENADKETKQLEKKKENLFRRRDEEKKQILELKKKKK